MNEVVAYVFKCGHEGVEVGYTNRKLTCPSCGEVLVKKKYRCQNSVCRCEFYHSKNGSHTYCPDCADKIKKANESGWKKEHQYDKTLKRSGKGVISLDDVHDRVDCIHRRKCLMGKIAKNTNVCLDCPDYKSEFDDPERFLKRTGADCFETLTENGGLGSI